MLTGPRSFCVPSIYPPTVKGPYVLRSGVIPLFSSDGGEICDTACSLLPLSSAAIANALLVVIATTMTRTSTSAMDFLSLDTVKYLSVLNDCG